MVKDNLASGSLQRALTVGKLSLGIAGSYLGYQIQNLFLDSDTQELKQKEFQQKSAKKVREKLQSLRGPVMKLGQFFSMQSQFIPEGVIQELAELQMHAPSMHPTLMRTQFKKSLGKYPEEVFRRFDLEPFAAASLGQVHYAVTPSGEEVAVKIQYPAIRQAVQNDFSLLRTAAFPLRINQYLSTAMLQEMERGILLETDYLNETQNIEFFREHLEAYSYMRIPKVFPEYTTEKVLTMSFMRGKYLDDLLQNQPDQPLRDRLGARLFELFHYQVFRMKAVHADPHPGNYLYGEDGTISLIDFGCVKYIPNTVAEYLWGIMERICNREISEYVQLLEFIYGEETNPEDEKQRRLLYQFNEFCELIFPGDMQPVDFGKPTIFEQLYKVWKCVAQSKRTKPDFFFIKRAELGLYNTLYKLGARFHTTPICERILKEKSA